MSGQSGNSIYYAADDEHTIADTRQNIMDKEWKKSKAKIFKNLLAQRGLLLKALEKAEIYKDGVFDTKKVICSGDLTEFVEFLEQNKAIYETQTGLELARDIKTKPTGTVNRILKEFGLRAAKIKPRKINGKKIYRYKLYAPMIAEMEKYAAMKRQSDKNRNHD